MRQAFVIGNLGDNAQIKENPTTGRKFLSVRLASNEYNFKTKQTDTIWLSLVSNNERLMENVNKWTKGSSVWASGQYTDSFSYNQDGTLRVDKTGLPVIERTVYVESMDWVGGGKSDRNQQAQPQGGFQQQQQFPTQGQAQQQGSMAQSYGQQPMQAPVQPTQSQGYSNPPQHQYVNVGQTAPAPAQAQAMPQLPPQPAATPRYEQQPVQQGGTPFPAMDNGVNEQLPF